jgi:hypothetical protein
LLATVPTRKTGGSHGRSLRDPSARLPELEDGGASMVIVEFEGPHAVAVPDSSELIAEDGIPLESPWHRAAIALLIEVLSYA